MKLSTLLILGAATLLLTACPLMPAVRAVIINEPD